MFVVHARSIPDPSARYGMRKITLCDACDYTFRECHKELRVLLGDQFLPDCPVSLDQISAIIRPKPHGLHEVVTKAAEALVSNIIATLRVE
jgi:hypothetical protein